MLLFFVFNKFFFLFYFYLFAGLFAFMAIKNCWPVFFKCLRLFIICCPALHCTGLLCLTPLNAFSFSSRRHKYWLQETTTHFVLSSSFFLWVFCLNDILFIISLSNFSFDIHIHRGIYIQIYIF